MAHNPKKIASVWPNVGLDLTEPLGHIRLHPFTTTAPLDMCTFCSQQLPAKLLDQSAADTGPVSPAVVGMWAVGLVQSWCSSQRRPASQNTT